jgi:hypothetical protein
MPFNKLYKNHNDKIINVFLEHLAHHSSALIFDDVTQWCKGYTLQDIHE